jgi:predicted metal-binding membrane protein
MGEPQLDPLLVQRNIILVLLLLLATMAWAVLVWASPGHVGMDTPVVSSTGTDATLFLTSWVVMMLAMMLPATAPIFLAFHKVQAAKYQPDEAFASTWVFVTAYLLVWALAGIAAYTGELVASSVRATLGPAVTVQFGAAIIMLGGIYQLTPWKELCLRECRTPISMTVWHGEKASVLNMGLLHGFFCVGCCWLLFAALFPLGMSVEAMAAITLIILAEKTLPWPTPVRYITAVALVLYGVMQTVGDSGVTPRTG